MDHELHVCPWRTEVSIVIFAGNVTPHHDAQRGPITIVNKQSHFADLRQPWNDL